MPLVAFDFDGTHTDVELNIRLGRLVGVEDEMGAITAQAINGELPYSESLRERVGLLEGLPLRDIDRSHYHVTVRPSGADVLWALADADVKVGVLTGGFERGVQSALEDAGVSIDRFVANRLLTVDGVLTGEVTGPLVEGAKDTQLRELANEFDVPLRETVAVGNGDTDRSLLQSAGLAIGSRRKPAVEEVIDESVDTMSELLATVRRRGLLPAESVNC